MESPSIITLLLMCAATIFLFGVAARLMYWASNRQIYLIKRACAYVHDNLSIWVRHEGANYQRVKVPSGKLSVHPGSYPGSGVGRPPC